MKPLLLFVPPVLGGLVLGAWMHSFLWLFAGIGIGAVVSFLISVVIGLIILGKMS